MTLLRSLALAFFVTVLASTYLSERRGLEQLERGRPEEALARCERLRAGGPKHFIEPDEIDVRCEQVAATALSELMDRCDFTMVVPLIAKVLAPPDSGVEAQVSRLAATVAGAHLACVRQLAEDPQSRPDRVLEGIARVERAYDDAAVQSEARHVKGEYLLSLVRRRAEAGDPVGAVEAVARIGGDQPLGIQNDGEAAAFSSVAVAADRQQMQGDFAGLYRTLSTVIGKSSTRPNLQARLVAFKEVQVDERLFGRALRKVAAVPAPAELGGKTESSSASLAIGNQCGKPLRVVLLSDPPVDRTIAPDSAADEPQPIPLPAGNYVQMIELPGKDTALFGVVSITGGKLRQVITPALFNVGAAGLSM